MKKILYIILLAVLALASCSEKNDVYNPYENWQSRNAKWFEDTVAVARMAIAQAKQQYGDDWQQHCEWRMYKSLFRTSSVGPLTDSICVKILESGNDPEGKGSPLANDSAHISYKGWIMPTIDYIGNGTEMGPVQEFFDTSYYGEYNPETSAPRLMSIGGLIEGFATAVQYMVEGDSWMVYIPYTLAYGANGTGKIRGYSTLQFHIHLVKWYKSGSGTTHSWE